MTEDRRTTPTAAEAVTDLTGRYAAAAAALDVEGLLALYTEDAVVVDAAYRDPFPTREAWRGGVEEWFGGLEPGDTNHADLGELRVQESGDLAFAHGTAHYASQLAGGTVRYEVRNRLTWVLRRGEDGSWRIAHEHTSLAVDMETGRGITD